jgi:hypothetical protein
VIQQINFDKTRVDERVDFDRGLKINRRSDFIAANYANFDQSQSKFEAWSGDLSKVKT